VEGSREHRVFCNWINSLGPEVEMTDLLEDAKSGVRLLEVIEKISADKKIVDWKMVNKKAKVQIKSIENCNYLVTCAQALGCHIVNLGGKDIFDQNEKLVTPIDSTLSHSALTLLLYAATSQPHKRRQPTCRFAN
jgi:hypothetical protein